MKWIWATIGGFFLGLAFLMAVISFRAGVHLPVEVKVSEQAFGPFSTLYFEAVGPYHEVAQHIMDIEDFAKSHHLICTRTFGHYLDDPRGIDHERLRSHVGCLFDSQQDFSEITALKEFQDKKYRIGQVKFDQYVIGSFEGSPAMGALKVYPKIFRLAAEKNLQLNDKAFEIYEVKSSKKVKTQVLFEIKLAHNPGD